MDNIYDASNDDDEFYTQPTEEVKYMAYLRKPVAGKQISILIFTTNNYLLLLLL